MPPPVNRTNIVVEPGLIQFNGAYFYSKGPIKITQKDDRFDIESASFGKIEDRATDRSFEITLRPVGAFESLSVLFPHFSTLMGADIFGSSDTPLTVWTQSGRKYVFVNAAITTLPDINPKVGDTILGDITFTALIGKDKYPGDANAYYTLTGEETYPGDAAFSASAIITRHPELSYGSTAPFNDFATTDGVQIKHALTLSPVKINGLGTVGMRLKDYQITAQFTPAGAIEMSDILSITNANTALGSSPTVESLVIQYPGGAGFYVELFAASMTQASFSFGTGDGEQLIQGIEARATRLFSSGAAVPLAYVGTSD